MANRKVLLALVFVVFTTGWSFAQTETETEEETITAAETETTAETRFATMPKNTIAVDIGPTIIGIGIGVAGNLIGEEGLSSSGFGIGVQYERQLLEKLTVAGKFSYLGGGIGMTTEQDDVSASVKMSIASFSLEGHVRFYPWARNFFLDGMLGYGNLSTTFSGGFLYDDDVNGNETSKKVEAEIKATRSYFKFGAKLGWRIDFGRQGGFIFEPSLGWYGGAGLGDTLGTKLGRKISDEIKKVDPNANASDANVDLSVIDPAFAILEKFIFVGGPRLSLAFGWRF